MPVGLILYRLSLDLAYPLISQYYANSGMIMTEEAMPGILSWAIFLCSLPIMINIWNKNTLYSIMFSTLYLISFVPSTSLFMYIDPAPGFVFSFILYWSVLLLASYMIVNAKIKIPEIKSQRDYSIFIYMFVLLICAVVVYTSWRFRGLSFNFGLSVEHIDKLRLDVKIMSISNIHKRLLATANKILPIIMVYFLWRKKWIWAAAILFVSLLNFGIAGHKLVLFSTILSIVAFWCYRDWVWEFIPAALAFVNFAAIFLLDNFGIIDLIHHISRRVLFVPALLNYCYYDYFNSNGPDYYISSFVGKILKIPSGHKQDISHTIGEIYFNAPQMAANNGLYSDAFANLGVAGCIILPLLLCFSIFMLQYFSRNLPNKVLFSIVIVYSMTFISSFLSTIVFTHALAVLMLICYFMSSTKQNEGVMSYERDK